MSGAKAILAQSENATITRVEQSVPRLGTEWGFSLVSGPAWVGGSAYYVRTERHFSEYDVCVFSSSLN